ncbi:MAG: four helix bundle protein [Flavobacteriales bacterium]|nr:four helix bundle suffix domain-containing protein [Flavobacteriales bacterium]MCB9166557.1 four helix bundle protein [Flavobacteriales bacterium]
MPERPPNSKVFPKSGGFEKLVGYQVAELLYDFTVRFTKKFIEPGSRTRDQMEQAARSGSRNIAEGSVFSATSKKVEMNLTNVAKASQTELRKDYQSFLRQNKLKEWPSDDPVRQELIDRRLADADALAKWTREVHTRHPDRSWAEIAGNIGSILSNVAIALLDRQLQRLGRDFEENGGFSERLYQLRKGGTEL